AGGSPEPPGITVASHDRGRRPLLSPSGSPPEGAPRIRATIKPLPYDTRQVVNTFRIAACTIM
ncbi:MAG: hypothetical protein ACJ8F3_08085, partial [Xanthobacteraceae bacterium]